MALLYNVTDLSGEYPMTTDTILSPQAYIDCMSAGCDDGGFPGTVLPCASLIAAGPSCVQHERQPG